MKLSIKNTEEYRCILKFYGDKTTKRTGVRLMNHIDEGLSIMDRIGASEEAKMAYCLHPVLQSDEDFNENFSKSFLENCWASSLILATEYRRVANSYLSTGSKGYFVGFTNKDIWAMLFADKFQNEKDFTVYHENSHPRSKELRDYFDNWFILIDNYA